MPFYSAHTSSGRLFNSLKLLCDGKSLSSFKLSKITDLSPTTTRKIYTDPTYIPSPDVLEKLCLVLDVTPGDLLKISTNMENIAAVCSGV